MGDSSTTRTGQLLNYLRYILTDPQKTSLNSFLWVAMGIDAFYVSDAGSATAQIREKVGSFIGKGGSLTTMRFNQMIKRLYSSRSKLLHGQVNIPRPHAFDADAILKMETQLRGALDLGTGILLATIQELVCRNWQEVDFDFSVTYTARERKTFCGK